MARAHIRTVDGVTVKLEGTPAEIASLLKQLIVDDSSAGKLQKRGNHNPSRQEAHKSVNDLLDELIAENFFRRPRGLNELKEHLANRGHQYPLTALSGPLLGYVMKRKLRRFKEAGKFVYAQRDGLS